MAAELTALSFVCAILLVVFLPIQRVYLDGPKLAIILWLFVYNLIHAINSIVWNDNDEVRAAVWCDLATKIMMGANLALPGAFLCLARRLELLSSSRKISTHKSVIRNRAIFDIVLCCIFPILYMSLHFIAQDHRFDLVKNFGCSPSVHLSTLSAMLIWGPPLTLSTVSLVLCAFAMHHASRLSSYRFMEHLQPRSSSVTTTIFYRQLTITMVISSLLTFFNIFVFFTVSHYGTWTWASVHATVSEVNVVQSVSLIKSIEVRWWGIFVVSIVYILLLFAFGEESRDMYQYMKEIPGRFGKSSTPSGETQVSSNIKVNKTKGSRMRPLTLELKSGWDDMLHEKSPNMKLKSIRSKSPMLSSPSACSSPTPSSKSRLEDDEAFMNSTLSYLGSPTAKSLGITSPVTPVTPSPRAAFELLSNPIPTPPPTVQTFDSEPTPPKTPPPAKLPSQITSVLQAEWPVPPASPTPSRTASRQGSPSPTGSISRAHSRINSRPDSRPQSPSPSVLEVDLSEITFGIPLYSPSTPPHLRARPFENSSISSMNELGVHTPTSPSAPAMPKRGILKRSSMRSLNRKLSRERLSAGSSVIPSDVIRMSIVHETV